MQLTINDIQRAINLDNVMKSVYTHTTSAKEVEYQRKIDDFFMSVIGKSRRENP